MASTPPVVRRRAPVLVTLCLVLLVSAAASAVSPWDPARVTLTAGRAQSSSAAPVTPGTGPYAPSLTVYGPGGDRAGSGSVALSRILYDAYAAAVAGAPPGCHLRISLLAAIGTVESGSLDGSTIDLEHRAHVLGPLLNGTGVRAIPDTDNGRWDGSTRWDRAVGPMQFIPATWRTFGRDGDHDGIKDPQDIEDSAAGAAAYLCSNGRDLSRPGDLRAAVLAYNHSSAYLELVRTLMTRFENLGLRPVDDTGPTTLTSILRATATAARSDRPAVRRWVRAVVRLAATRAPSPGPSSDPAPSRNGRIAGAASPTRSARAAASVKASALPGPSTSTSTSGASSPPTGTDPATSATGPSSDTAAPGADEPPPSPDSTQTDPAPDTPSATATAPAPPTGDPTPAEPSCTSATDPAPGDPTPAGCPTDPATVTEQTAGSDATSTGASASAGP